VGVGRSEEGGQQWWCGFNASVLTTKGKRHDKVLLEDEAETASSSWLYGKEAGETRRGGMVTPIEGEVAPGTGKGRDDASWVDADLTRLKNEENSHGRFRCYKWTMKI
jgi:hypothetical protein